jgi:hypothetical protein
MAVNISITPRLMREPVVMQEALGINIARVEKDPGKTLVDHVFFKKFWRKVTKGKWK